MVSPVPRFELNAFDSVAAWYERLIDCPSPKFRYHNDHHNIMIIIIHVVIDLGATTSSSKW